MAKKNEILLSIALEGDDEIKSKLKAVREAGKQSLADIDRNLGETQKRFGGVANQFPRSTFSPGGGAGLGQQLSEAFAPLTQASGIGGLVESIGAGGLFRTLGSGLLSPGGLVAGITALLAGLAKVGEESDKSRSRLKALGGLGGSGGFDALGKQAKLLGTDIDNVQPSMEKLLDYREQLAAKARQTHNAAPEFITTGDLGGGKDIYGETPGIKPNPAFPVPSKTELEKSYNALFAAGRQDSSSGKEISDSIGQFLADGLSSNALTPQSISQLRSKLPHAADLVAKAATDFRTPGRVPLNNAGSADLLAYLGPDRGLRASDIFKALPRQEPGALDAAANSHGFTEAAEGLYAGGKRLVEQLGGDHAGLTKGIDAAANFVNDAADNVDRRVLNPRDYEPGGPNFIGPVAPEERAEYSKPDILDVVKTLITGGKSGDQPGSPNFIGPVNQQEQAEYDRSQSPLVKGAKFLRDGPSFLQGTPGEAVDAIQANPIVDFLSKAFGNPAALQEAPRPAEGPSALSPPQPQISQQQPVQQQGAFDSFLESLTAKLNGLNQPNLKVDEPASGLGIRGSLEDPSQDVASVKDAISQFASAIYEGVKQIKNSSASAEPAAPVAPAKDVQAAADGGLIRRLDSGGGVSGPGTSTSDSIPAMLSDGEYVLRAQAARKIGRAHLDWLNAGMPGYAAGGNVSADASSLGGNHQITATPDGGAIIDGVLYPKGSAILDDPVVRQKIAESLAGSNSSSSRRKYKSDFVGNFGGHEFDTKGSFAHGGAVQRLANGGAVGSRASRLAGFVSRFAGGGIIDVSHLALGGNVGAFESVPAAENLGTGSPWSDMPHLGSMDVTTDHGSARVVGPEDTLRHMVRNARDAEVVQTGPSPSWNR